MADLGNVSSEIFYAYTTTTWIDVSMVASTTAEYSIAPDIVVNPTSGIRHFTFMKDTQTANCLGGNESEYAVYYRGPFENTSNDGGESGGVFLPIILKNG
jgi:hypothetical protein